MSKTDPNSDDSSTSIERLERASAPALHRLRDYRMLTGNQETVRNAIDYAISRPNHRKGLGCSKARRLLELGGGEFCLRYESDSTIIHVRWEHNDVYLVKRIWVDAWPDCRDDGEIVYELKASSSTGHYLDHLLVSHRNPTIVLRENHFDEPLPDDERIDDRAGNTEKRFDVLVSATRETVDEKHDESVPEGHHCYWSVSGTPQQTAPGQRIWFAVDADVVAGGEITELEDGKIWFTPVTTVSARPPKEPPTRGYTYIDPIRRQQEVGR